MNKSTKTSDKTQEQGLSSDQIRAAIKEYRQYGLNAMPVKRNKHPLITGWNSYGDELLPWPKIEEAILLGADAIAIICGGISGFIALDIDNKYGVNADETWKKFLELPGIRTLIKKYNPPASRTQSGGIHVYLKCPGIHSGSCKLASALAVDSDGNPIIDENGNQKTTVLIETKEHGGYVLVDPSPGYKLLYNKDWGKMINWEPEDVDILIDAAISLDQLGKRNGSKRSLPSPGSIGKEFKKRYPSYILDWLQKNGYKEFERNGQEIRYTRPGKNEGTSVSYNYMGNGRLKIWSTTIDQLEAGQSYHAFHLFAIDEHGGDFGKARKALQGEYYLGDSPQNKERSTEDPEVVHAKRKEKFYCDPFEEPKEEPVTFSIGDVVTGTQGN